MTVGGEKINLLLVDDEREFLATMARALERRNVHVVGAASGLDALQLVGVHEFDVAVVDVKMPGMDGVELFHRLKATHPDLPVIMLTAHGTVSQAFETAKKGIFDYVAKPCDIAELLTKVQAAASARRAERTTRERKPYPSPAAVRVLLVDDETELLSSLTPVLLRRGLRVQTVCSGAEVLPYLEGALIDVVVLDIKMPGIDGIQTLRRIKSVSPDTEVILLSGHPEVENAVEGMKLGAFDYIVKPPDVEELAEKIKKAFRARMDKMERKRETRSDDITKRRPD